MSYITILSKYYPAVEAYCIGSDEDYSNLVWSGGDSLPPEQELMDLFLVEAKSNKIKSLSEACEQQILGGFLSSALGTPHGYDAEDVDQINILGAMAATGPRPGYPDGTSMPYAVRPVVDGAYQAKTYVIHTHAQLSQVVVDGAAYKLVCLQHFNELRNSVSTTNTLQEVEAVAW